MRFNFFIATLIILSVLQSCSDTRHHHTGQLDYVSHDRANEKYLRAGLKELKAFRAVYKDQWTSLPSTFPHSDYHLIRV
ncbi:MAG: hypothetical protein AAFP82_16470, partial [Bacteroidota bacterium]